MCIGLKFLSCLVMLFMILRIFVEHFCDMVIIFAPKENIYMAWFEFCSSKSKGQLGFRDSKKWNVANHGKYVWDIATKRDMFGSDGFM